MDEQTLPDSPQTPHIPDIIQRYLNGESLQVIAAQYHVNRQTLYNWMLAETGPEYEHLITKALVNRIADADKLLDESTDTFGIARAREAMRFTRMDFERRRPKLYGPKQELSVDNKITVVLHKPPIVVEGQATEQDG
jgi:transposase-like protein